MSTWVRHHILTRLFAGLWWVVMLVIALALVAGWIQLALEPRLIGLALMVFWTLLVGIPFAREAPNAPRMARMLIAGT